MPEDVLVRRLRFAALQHVRMDSAAGHDGVRQVRRVFGAAHRRQRTVVRERSRSCGAAHRRLLQSRNAFARWMATRPRQRGGRFVGGGGVGGGRLQVICRSAAEITRMQAANRLVAQILETLEGAVARCDHRGPGRWRSSWCGTVARCRR